MVGLNGIYSTLKNEHSSEPINTLILPSDCKYFSYSGCEITRLILNKEIERILIAPTEKFVYNIRGLKELYISKSLDTRSALDLVEYCVDDSFKYGNVLKMLDRGESFDNIINYIKSCKEHSRISKIKIELY